MIYFTSDPHYYHTNIIRFCDRPYKTVEEMNEVLVRNWNEVVKPEDTVYCLGDFSMAIRPVELFTPRLNGKKILVPGNHDFCHSYHKRSKKNEECRQKWIHKYIECGWEVLPEQTLITFNNILFKLCHFPYAEAWVEQDKYSKWRPVPTGEKYLIHGHTHSSEKIRGNQIHVGVDAWSMSPVSLERLLGLLDVGPN